MVITLFHLKRAITLLFLSICLSACATTSTLGRSDLLNFIQDGQTTREQTYLHLGEPSGLFEGERIISYRLGSDKAGYFVIGKAAGFAGVNTSLMMVFDEQGVLKKHSLVQLKEP